MRFVAGIALAAALSGQSRVHHDPVSTLDRQLAEGKAKLEFRENGFGYLASLMERLHLNADSQVLSFAKTSFQQNQISPKAPRALYFNDDVLMGMVQNGFIEIISLDPASGPQFFTLDNRSSEAPRFKNEFGSCMPCHGPVNRWAPGLIIASVFPAQDGTAFFKGDNFLTLTDPRTPFNERWGGLYVHGAPEKFHHRGNSVSTDFVHPYDLSTAAGPFDTSKYPLATGDVVALMTLEHQVSVTNQMLSIGALYQATQTFPVPAEQLNESADKLVAALLFAGEVRLPSPVKGVSTFSKTFPQAGPRDRKGRSLRDFDLETRIFKYPLSYMIYSATFDGLPDAAKENVYRRLYDALKSNKQRRALLEILTETKKNLPTYFKL